MKINCLCYAKGAPIHYNINLRNNVTQHHNENEKQKSLEMRGKA